MFNFFKKKKEPVTLDSVEAGFIEKIINGLSEKYPLFKQQWELETFAGVGKNPGGPDGSFTYYLSSESWNKLCDPGIDNYDVRNIKFLTYAGDKVIVDLYISEGLILGYQTTFSTKDIDLDTIDLSAIWEKHFLNDDYQEIESVIEALPKDQLKKLDMIKNTFKIEINGASYLPVI